MSYPPETSRSCHEADGRSDRSGGSGGAAGSSSGGVYGTLCGTCVGGTKVPAYTSTSYDVCNDPITSSHHNRIVSNWKKWSLGLDYLLQDSEGVALFKSYLQYEGCSNLLDFWFACQGFRSKVDSSDHRKITQLIKAIYRTYIRGSTCNTTIGLSTMLTESPVLMQPRAEPIRLRAETRKMIAERIARKYALDQTVFDPAQAEVEHFLRTTAYPAFLKSDVYVDFLQATLEGTNRGLHPPRPGCTEPQPMNAILGIPDYSGNFPLGGNILPTLEEDKELKSEEFLSRANPLGIGTLGAYNSDPNRVPSFPSSQRAYPLNCPHCSQYHFQGHQLTCPSSDGCNQQANYPPSRISSYGFRPTLGIMASNAPAPLTMENLQMTRLYRTELSLQQSFPYTPMTSGDPTSILNPRPQLTEGYLVGSRGYPYIRNCEPKTGGPRPHMNYVYTQWVDAIRPTLAHSADHMLATRIPTQPPNPYHISYAPASARDSEHHSLSSEARTDDTHSHTDSSHDGTTNRLWHCHYGHSHSSRPQPSRPTLKQEQQVTAQSQPSRSRPGDHADFQSATITNQTTFVSSPKPVLSNNDASTQVRSKQQQRTGHHHEAGASQSADHEHTRAQSKHQRRTLRRGVPGWRGSGDRGKSASGGGTENIATETTAPTSKSAARSHNLAERDPPAFFRLLSEKLQRVLDSQLSSERFDKLMTEMPTNQTAHSSTGEHDVRSPISDRNASSHDFVATSEAGTLLTADTGHPRLSGPSVLQRPWADRLLAAARVQHECHRDNPQAILEDHCSRIWAASADRTPTSSGSGSGGGGGGVLPLLTEHTSGSDGIRSTEFPSKPFQNTAVFQESSHVSSPLASQIRPRINSAKPQPIDTTEQWLVHSPRSKSSSRPVNAASIHPSSSAVGAYDRVARSQRRTPALGQEKHSVHPSSVLATHQLITESSSTGPDGGTECNLESVGTRHTDDQPQSACAITASGLEPRFAHHSASSSVVTSTVSVSTPGLLASPSSSGSPHSLVIGYYLGDDPVPYRSVWPSPEITLGQFKQLIPKKKGNFRYFFKKCSNEFDTGVVHQEITGDNTVLPLWEGKIVAKVERIE